MTVQGPVKKQQPDGMSQRGCKTSLKAPLCHSRMCLPSPHLQKQRRAVCKRRGLRT